jgi:hypothetical protein
MKNLLNLLTKNWLQYFCILIIFLQFSQIIYLKRAMFFQEFNVAHWKDRFEHSQWVLPVSRRPIGDDGIYSYASYRLMQGESIEATNANKPPVGLYLLGLSIQIFRNPLMVELLLGMGVVICFFFLSLKLLENKIPALMTTCLFSLEPFIFSNYSIALLDLPQLFFLLAHLLFLFYSTTGKKFNQALALLSGIFLGFFAETKPPLFLPIIIPLEIFYLYKLKQLSKFIFIIPGFIIAMLVPYFKFFQSGHNLTDYLKLHKYMAAVYYSGKNQLFPLSIWSSLLIGQFPDVVTGRLNKIITWWPILPIVTVFGLFQMFKSIFTKNLSIFLKGLGVFSIIALCIYTVVPSYPRYLIIIIPFLYIFTALLFQKYLLSRSTKLIFTIVSVAGLLYSTYLLLPNPDVMLQDFKYNFSNQYFQDIYQETLTKTNQRLITEKNFRKLTQGNLAKADIERIEFKEIFRSIPFIGKEGIVKYLVSYTTRDLGKFSEEKNIHIINEEDQWKIDWDWNILMNSFKPDYSFVSSIIPGKRGTVYDNKGNVQVQDSDSILMSINPEKIDTKREQEMLKLLKEISFQKIYLLQNAYLENPLPDTYVPIATSFVKITQKQQEQLSTFPGLRVDKYISRLYSVGSDSLTIANTQFDGHGTRIYSSSYYRGADGFEKKYDDKLSGYNGGTLQMINEKGEIIRTLIEREPKNGEDIILP